MILLMIRKAARSARRIITTGFITSDPSILRVIGILCVIFGLRLIFRPLSVIADVIPILGTIVEAGAGIVAMILGLAWSMCVIAVAWVRFRPLIAGGLIAGALVLVVLLYMKGRKSQ